VLTFDKIDSLGPKSNLGPASLMGTVAFNRCIPPFHRTPATGAGLLGAIHRSGRITLLAYACETNSPGTIWSPVLLHPKTTKANSLPTCGDDWLSMSRVLTSYCDVENNDEKRLANSYLTHLHFSM